MFSLGFSPPLLFLQPDISPSEREQIQLWNKQRQALSEIGQLEEELGLHVYGCARALTRLNVLQHEVRLLKEKQAELSNGVSQSRGLDYMHTIQDLSSRDHLPRTIYPLEHSATSPAAYFFRRVGSLFYGEPSFISPFFQSGWNSILRAARRA